MLCCQAQLISLCIVLLCDPTHKLFLSIPQQFADRNKPNSWVYEGHMLSGSCTLWVTHIPCCPLAVQWKLLSHYTQQQYCPNCSKELELNGTTHFPSSEPCSSCVAAEVCSAHWMNTPQVVIADTAAHVLLEECLLFPQNSPGYSVQQLLFYYPFLFFRFQFCKTNAYTVVKLPSLFFLIIWGGWVCISH